MKEAYTIISEVMAELIVGSKGETRSEDTMKVITVATQKGGVGKTTTALALTAGLTERGYKTLLVDVEGQRNASLTVGTQSDKPTVLEVLTGKATARGAITESLIGDFISGNKRLSLIDKLIDEERQYTALRDALKPLNRSYDYCIIDTPPALGTLTLNALTASDFVIVPCEADLYSLQGLTDLAETIEAVRAGTNKKLKTLGILLTKHSTRYTLSKELQETLEQLTTAFNTRVFDTYIRYSQKCREAQFKPQGLLKYAPRSTVTQDYRALTDEILHLLE